MLQNDELEQFVVKTTKFFVTLQFLQKYFIEP